jgi:hypothetical protein
MSPGSYASALHHYHTERIIGGWELFGVVPFDVLHQAEIDFRYSPALPRSYAVVSQVRQTLKSALWMGCMGHHVTR